jgi:hypothetical protein
MLLQEAVCLSALPREELGFRSINLQTSTQGWDSPILDFLVYLTDMGRVATS